MERQHPPQLINRLKTARGHLDGVVRMLEEGAYCPDVLKQLAAVQGSLEQAARLVLRGHLETCVAEAMRDGRGPDVVDELMEALRFQRITSPPPEPRKDNRRP